MATSFYVSHNAQLNGGPHHSCPNLEETEYIPVILEPESRSSNCNSKHSRERKRKRKRKRKVYKNESWYLL